MGVAFLLQFPSLGFVGIWDAERGGGNTGAETAALHGFENNTAYDLYTLSAIEPYYTFAVRRTGLPEVKTILQRRHFCPCTPCTTGDYHHCLYQPLLGVSHLNPPAFRVSTFNIDFLCSELPLFCMLFLAEWHEENMEINNVHENSRAVLCQEHAATIRLQLEETLGTFSGYFFFTFILNEAVQRLTFGYVTRSTSYNDVCFRLHILQPFVEPGEGP